MSRYAPRLAQARFAALSVLSRTHSREKTVVSGPFGKRFYSFMTRIVPVFGIALILAACSGGGGTTTAPSTTRSSGSADIDSVPMRSFPALTYPRGVARSNSDIALEFIDLTFSLESGERLSRLTKFDGPVTVAFNQQPSASGRRDLAILVDRLRREAGIDIRVTPVGSPAAIKIERVPARQFRSIVPGAACFVVPNVKDLRDLRKNARLPRVNWAAITRRTKAAIFIPDGISPQEERDCLHEELAQALGPLNDLYRVGDSVYNDDNFHVILTPYDMLILRAIYSPQMRNGMTRTEAAQAIRAILPTLNPRGNGAPGRVANKTQRSWAELIEKALGPTGNLPARIETMSQAVNQARALRYNDNRLAFAHYARARLKSNRRDDSSIDDFQTAYNIYSQLYGFSDIHTAKLSVQIASFAFSQGNIGEAQRLLGIAIPAARNAQDASTLFKLLALQAEVFESQGQTTTAARLRQEAIGWGKYGLGDGREIADTLRRISALRIGFQGG